MFYASVLLNQDKIPKLNGKKILKKMKVRQKKK